MHRFFSTLRFRTTVLHVIVFGITLLVFSSALYFIYKRNQESDFDKLLYNRALGIARGISINSMGQLEINQLLIAESGRLFPFQIGNEFIQIRSPDGISLARSNSLGQNSLPLDSKLLELLQHKQFVYHTIFGSRGVTSFWGEGNLRILSMPLIAQGNLQILLQLGVSTYAHDQSLDRLKTITFFIGVPLTLLLTGIGGWWLAGHAFQPINRIVLAAQKLGIGCLEKRLPVPEAEDELRRLSITLNEMLSRLERTIRSQQRFVADASHELKTPLTILKGELDVLRQQPRTPKEYEAFLESASEELQRLSQIVQNLLILARADSGWPLELKGMVRLDEIVLGVVERLQPFAKNAQVKLTMKIGESPENSTRNPISDDALTIAGDADLLTGLFFNLVHNAIKYSAAGQTVEIVLESGAKNPAPIVSVRDFGTGIRAEDLPHVFERFYRAENPARHEVSGTGLGLAIAQWIVQVHQAELSVISKPAEGSTFSVSFRNHF